MKRIALVMALSLLVIAGSALFAGAYMKQASELMGEKVSAMQRLAQGENWAEIALQYGALKLIWEERKSVLSLFCVHEDTDNMEILLDELLVCIEEKSKLHLKLTLSGLSHAAEHLYHRDAPRVENIL